jgi:riboflavin synthase
MIAGARLDGHMVQGHVDTTAILKNISDKNGSLEFEFSFLSTPECVLVNKGSICIDGTSLTVVDVKNNLFSVHIIPYTLENTVFSTYKIGCEVNIEFDIIGKYIQKIMPIYLSK